MEKNKEVKNVTESGEEIIKPFTFIKAQPEEVIKPISFTGDSVDPEKRTYILLYYATMDGEDVKSFEVLEGRTAIYKFIIDLAEFLDIHESKVLVNNVKFEDALSVYRFMKLMETHYQDGFDIEDYNSGDETPEEGETTYE